MKKKEFIPFDSKGEYPVKQVIYVNVDSVLGPLLNSVLFKPTYGLIDILHQIRKLQDDSVDNKLSDVEMLMLTTSNVVSTCWPIDRTIKCLPAYCKARKWQESEVRVYCLGWWVNGKKFKRP